MASTVLRKFGFKKHEPRESDARIKLQKELFAFNKVVEHGFPHKPTALAYDPKLKLLAIGTKSGAVKILGAPGVEFSGQHEEDVSINNIFFIPEQARVITHCSNNSLHLWSINTSDGKSVLERTKHFEMEESKLKMISTCCMTANGEHLLVGTEGGNIHLLDTLTFKLNDQIVYQDVVMQNVPDDFKVAQGAVEAIAQHPTNADKFLIGYNRGGIVLWDLKESNADQTYNASQQLESVAWHRDGTQFMSAHADGSYIVWSTSDSSKPKEQANTPYGPFPCKAINKILWKTAKADNLVVFSGGMPRPSYSDRHTITVQQGKQVVFDFTSRVVDFVVISASDEMEDSDKGEYNDPQSLIVLVEEELVAIDLQAEGWPTYRQPYLCSPHSSAITCSHHAGRVTEQLWNKLTELGETQEANHSHREWPIWGGKSDAPDTSNNRELLLTGHEDGTVRFWDVSGVSMKLLCKLGTEAVFGFDFTNAEAIDANAENEWPPFRKVGTFDPYSDDPRLGIQKLTLCAISETLVVGGTAGQVIILTLDKEEKQIEVKNCLVDIVSDRDNFVWKGHEALPVVEGEIKFPAGFQPQAVMQLHPPASITALALQSEWQLVAAGTAHGMGVYDYTQNKKVSVKCTLNPNDLTGAGESPMSRGKSFKKSLRESFRRFRKRRSERRKKLEEKAVEEKKEEVIEEKAASGDAAAAASEEVKEEVTGAQEGEVKDEAAAAAPAEAAAGDATTAAAAVKEEDAITPAAPAEDKKEEKKEATPSQGTRTLERPVEARSTEDAMASMVRYIYFADTFLLNGQTHSPTVWAGTNAGSIFVFQITVPESEKRDSDEVTCTLAKEIHLKHHAPVVSVCIVDKNACPLPGPFEVEHELAKAPDMSGGHQLVICSEEQFKIFSLPNLKPQNKYKLTAHEGSKVRKIGYVKFASRSDENYVESDLVVLTNQGDLHVFTVPHLRCQLKTSAIRKDNVNGIVSCVLSQNGEGIFPCSPSEFMRFSLSARSIIAPDCSVELKEGARPAEPEPEPEVIAAEPVAAAAEEGKEEEKEAEKEGEEGAADVSAVSELANDSTMTADLTIDSVKVHLSEESSKMLITSSSVSSKTVVTRTLVKETTDADGNVTSSESTTVTTAEATSD